MNFLRTKVIKEQPEKKENKPNIKHKLVWGLVAMLIIIYFIFNSVVLINKIIKARDEVSFAYNKPELVKVLRESYETKQRELDKSFTVKEKSANDKLIEAVTDQLSK